MEPDGQQQGPRAPPGVAYTHTAGVKLLCLFVCLCVHVYNRKCFYFVVPLVLQNYSALSVIGWVLFCVCAHSASYFCLTATCQANKDCLCLVSDVVCFQSNFIASFWCNFFARRVISVFSTFLIYFLTFEYLHLIIFCEGVFSHHTNPVFTQNMN